MARTRNEEAFEAKRQHILQAATGLFIEHGFHQTGMAAICEAAGKRSPSCGAMRQVSEIMSPSACEAGIKDIAHTTAKLKDQGRQLDVEDDRGRLLWDYRAPEARAGAMQRALPFGPFLALGAVEFLFFGQPLLDAYLSLFD